MSGELVLSSTSIGKFLECPRQWYYAYVLRTPGSQSVPAALGTAVHAGIEALWKGTRDPVAALRASWVTEAALIPPADLLNDREALADGVKMLSTYKDKVYPTFQPRYIEAPFRIRVHGIVATGLLDAADDLDVHDTKTRSGKTIAGRKPSEFRPHKHVFQASLYACAYKAITGRWPRKIMLDVLTRRGTFKAYEIAPDFGDLRTSIEVTREGIAQADFSPSGAASGHCRICPFRTICPYSTVREQS